MASPETSWIGSGYRGAVHGARIIMSLWVEAVNLLAVLVLAHDTGSCPIEAQKLAVGIRRTIVQHEAFPNPLKRRYLGTPTIPLMQFLEADS